MSILEREVNVRRLSVDHTLVDTIVDGGSLALIEILGVGGYGVVYRAIDTRQSSDPKSCAVKCLVSSGHQTPRQRQIHIREIALHQLASAHPGVVTLHRVVEEGHNTFIVMDYAPDHDLLTQILHSCRYLGDDALIKDIFLQLLDAVEYCHALGIYHRDLKPENILCFDNGLRITITDFGLATTDKFSNEFRTGSIHHMSPECQGGEFAPTGNYFPMSNDIWSLGIILLNLATGGNPWKSATQKDPRFQAYLRDPMNFLPSVLPISLEVNKILVGMLEVDWRKRMTLREVRHAIEEVTSVYSDGVIFEGSMARCPRKSGMETDSALSGTDEVKPQLPPAQSTHFDIDQEIVETRHQYTSSWSLNSSSDLVFAAKSCAQSSSYGAPWTRRSSCGATWGALDTPAIFSSSSEMDLFEATHTPGLTQSPGSSSSATPNNFNTTIGTQLHHDANPRERSSGLALMDNSDLAQPRIYHYEAGDDFIEAKFSTHTSMRHTVIEYGPYSSMTYINSPNVRSSGGDKGGIAMPYSALTTVGEDKDMASPSVWTTLSAAKMSSYSSYSLYQPPNFPFPLQSVVRYMDLVKKQLLPNKHTSCLLLTLVSLPGKLRFKSDHKPDIVSISRHLQAHPRLLHGLNSLIRPQYRIECITTNELVRFFVVVDVEQRQSRIYSCTGVSYWFPSSDKDIRNILQRDDDYRKLLLELPQDHDLLSCLAQVLQEIIDDKATGDVLRRIARKYLHRLGKEGILPPSMFIHFMEKADTESFFNESKIEDSISGGFCDAHKITVHGVPMCFRVLRQWQTSNDKKIYQEFCRETSIWRQLRHPNVLPLIGVSMEIFPRRYCFVIPWMNNGSVISYLKAHPEQDKCFFIKQIIEGLAYLHQLDPPVAHKDLKGDNILVGPDLTCFITDFGLSSMLDSQRSRTAGRGTQYWMAPELFGLVALNLDPRPRDVYSLGCTISEILTLQPPQLIWLASLRSLAPEIPPQRVGGWPREEDNLWTLVKACIRIDPEDRPSIQEVAQYLSVTKLLEPFDVHRTMENQLFENSDGEEGKEALKMENNRFRLKRPWLQQSRDLFASRSPGVCIIA